jgi:hypothetical protein
MRTTNVLPSSLVSALWIMPDEGKQVGVDPDPDAWP